MNVQFSLKNGVFIVEYVEPHM